MTEISGRALSGLDEFKLRLGHISVICETARYQGGSAYRLEKDVAARLTEPVRIGSAEQHVVGHYLHTKKLCPESDVDLNKTDPRRDYRYPDIAYRTLKAGKEYELIKNDQGEDAPSIWFQDYCLAQPHVRSRTGAVTATAKSGSKTGVSHIVDWAIELDLISKSGMPSPIAAIVAYKLHSRRQSLPTPNPYALGAEKVALAYAYLSSDFDVFSRLIPLLNGRDSVVSKGDATAIYVEAVNRLTKEAESASSLARRQTNPIYALWRDLDKSARRSRKEPNQTSTAWHRTSSRFEVLTDLGLLSKECQGKDHRYEYKYCVEDAIRYATESLTDVEQSSDWIDIWLVDVLLGTRSNHTFLPVSTLCLHLPTVLEALRRPTAPLPLEAVTLGLCIELIEHEQTCSLRSIKESLVKLAREHPEYARLSRGTTAESAGMISLNSEKFPNEADIA